MRRSKGDRALVEGPHLIADALAAGLALEDLLATPEFLESDAGRALVPRLPRPPRLVTAAALDALADADSPRGILAIAKLPRGGAETLPVAAGGVYVYADGLQDPGNVGALARVAEAAGAAGLALSPGCVHPNHPRALRGSAGSLLRLPTAVDVAADALARHLAAAKPRWLALVPRAGADLYAADLAGSLVLLVGAEGTGLAPELLARADERITVPLAAPVESLNAAVAAAVALFEIRRRRLP